jgi:hypothetical protein
MEHDMTSPLFFPLVGELSKAWWQLATDASEMLTASTQVVGHRTARMAMAGPMPNERDRDEFSLMRHEKNEAASESVKAMSSGFVKLSVELALETSRQMWAVSAATVALASSSTPAQWFERQTALTRIIAKSPVHPLQLANSATHLVHDGLGPIHDRATGNARRLGAL